MEELWTLIFGKSPLVAAVVFIAPLLAVFIGQRLNYGYFKGLNVSMKILSFGICYSIGLGYMIILISLVLLDFRF